MRIGLVLSVLDEEYQISVFEGIKRKAKEYGFELVCFQLETADLNTDAVISRIAEPAFFNLDCIILLTSVITDNYEIKTKDDVRKIWGNIPVISIGQEVLNLPSLLVKTEDSIKKLLDHMVFFHGYRRFLYISGSESHKDAIIREKIFFECMQSYKKLYPEITYTIENASFTETSAIDAMTSFFHDNPNADIDAVMCANDNMAIGVYKFLKMNKENGFVKELAVTGFDDIPQSRFSNPSLTTVSQSINLLGEKAVDVVKELLLGKSIKNNFYVGSEVIFRESCGCRDEIKEKQSAVFFNQLQKKYINSENMLRIVTRLGQSLNFAQDCQGIRYVMKEAVLEFNSKNFSVLKFLSRDKDLVELEALFVYKNGCDISEKYEKRTLSLGDFYKELSSESPLIFKYLYSGDEIVGCILYDVPIKGMPYINSVSINLAQALVRIQLLDERQRYALQLEKDVAVRTAEVVEANKKMLEVEAQVLKVSEMERQRFSNDLHDDICQRLAGISMLCKSYSAREQPVTKGEMLELSHLIGDTLQTTRQYAHNSYPVELEKLGLNQSVGNLCNSFEKQTEIKCRYSWNIPPSITFSDMQALNIFRIVQESLHNVMKHSGARSVFVTIAEENRLVSVSVCDDGKGFSAGGKKRGLGLDSMQYRANQIDAKFSIAPIMPHGTEIKIEFLVGKA